MTLKECLVAIEKIDKSIIGRKISYGEITGFVPYCIDNHIDQIVLMHHKGIDWNKSAQELSERQFEPYIAFQESIEGTEIYVENFQPYKDCLAELEQ